MPGYSTVLCFIKVVVAATIGERTTRRFRLERPEEGATYAAVEKEASLDERGASPAVLVQQSLSERGEDEGAHARAAHGETRREGTPLLEVVRDADDGGEIDHA